MNPKIKIIPSNTVWLGFCKLDSEILKEAKNTEKSLKNHIFRLKKVIYERF